MRIYESSALPIHPTPSEDARRIVRHGLADVLAWLREEPGPKPGVPTHMLLISGDIWASPEYAAQLRQSVVTR